MKIEIYETKVIKHTFTSDKIKISNERAIKQLEGIANIIGFDKMVDMDSVTSEAISVVTVVNEKPFNRLRD